MGVGWMSDTRSVAVATVILGDRKCHVDGGSQVG